MNNILKWLFRLCITLVVLYVSARLITSKPWMMLHEGMYDSHADITWDYEYAVTEIIDYLNGRTDSLEFPSYPGGDDVLMTERGLLHMIDVKILYSNGRIMAAIAFVTASIIGVQVFDKEKIIEALKGVWIVPITFSLFIGTFMLLDFRTAFTLFHKLLFSNDLWLLSWTDPLIVMLPPTFFMLSGLAIILIFVSIHLGLVYYAYKTSDK